MNRSPHIEIAGRRIAGGEPVYVVAEISANHNGDFERAIRLIREAKEAGADAVKLQTYTPDTLTLRSAAQAFRISGGSPWAGRTLHDLYSEACTPWEWQPALQALAGDLGITLFSTPFDPGAVDYLERMGVPAYKVASFEIVDLPLLRRVARTGKPVILSTGMATLAEIEEAVRAIRDAGGRELALLKCTSAYPTPPAEMNLRTIPHLQATFQAPAGLSDHSLDPAVPVIAVALGACIVEKHITLSRSEPGPDSAFSLEPDEFGAMVRAIRDAEQALGAVRYGPTPSESASLVFRRSLFLVEDARAGELLTERNVRSIRPGSGLHPRHLPEVLGRRLTRDAARGTPLAWELVAGGKPRDARAHERHTIEPQGERSA